LRWVPVLRPLCWNVVIIGRRPRGVPGFRHPESA
jgi:hypothetical protein